MGDHGDLIFCGIADQARAVGKGDIRSVTLIVGDNLNTIVWPARNACIEIGSCRRSQLRVKAYKGSDNGSWTRGWFGCA